VPLQINVPDDLLQGQKRGISDVIINFGMKFPVETGT